MTDTAVSALRSSLRAPGRVPAWTAQLAGVALLAGTALLAWGAALAAVPHREVGDLGLVSVLPAWSTAGFVPLAAAMAWLLHRPTVPAVPATLVTLAVIAILYGSSPLLSGEPRISAAWRHLGVIDFIVRTGSVDPSVDVYHNWPGYFALAATLAEAAGIRDLRTIALWAPVWQSLLTLPALYLLLTSLTADRRVAWLGIWVFFASNWIGQDYLSPQAMGFLVYLVLVALIVRWLAHRDARADPDGGDVDGWRLAIAVRGRRVVPRAPGRAAAWLAERLLTTRPPLADGLPAFSRAALAAAVAAVFGYVVTAHQLTPFFLLAAALVLFALLRLRWVVLFPMMLVMIAAWALFAAVPYLAGHIDQIAATSGGLGGVGANVGERFGGSPEHRLVVLARLVLTAAVWAVAGLGVLRRLRAGRWDVTTVALAGAPFPLFALQSYGGEMLLRIALFALPAMGVLVAFAVLPRAGDVRAWRTATVFVLALGMLAAFPLTRYGNERLETFTTDEVAAVERLYAIAEPGSMFIGVSGNVPWKFTRYEAYRYRPQGDATYLGDPALLLETAAGHHGPVYLLVTRAQRAAAEVLGGAAPGAFDAFTAGLLDTGWFEVLLENPDALVARYTGPTAGS